MNDLLPWTKCLIESTVFKQTTLAEDAQPSDPFIAVDSVSWFSAGDQIAIGDVVATIESIEIDPYTHPAGLLLLDAPLGIDANAGAPVKKLRAVNPYMIFIGDYRKVTNPPCIRLSGTSLKTESLTIGGLSWIHEIDIDVMVEADEHTTAYMDMITVAKEIRDVLLRYRSIDLGCRYLYYAMPDIDYGAIEGTTLSAAQIKWTLREESLLAPRFELDYQEQLEALTAKEQDLQDILDQMRGL